MWDQSLVHGYKDLDFINVQTFYQEQIVTEKFAGCWYLYQYPWSGVALVAVFVSLVMMLSIHSHFDRFKKLDE